MRVLCLGLDGADYDLVCKLLAQGRLPTLAGLSRQGAFGALRSTIPAFTPTAWSSFLTGLNPGGHGIFAFTSNPNRGGGRLENAASRAGAPLWRYLGAAGIRSAFVTVPFTHPPEPLSGIIVTGFGGPRRPEIVPAGARNAILAAHPDLRVSRHPADLEDFAAATATLVGHVDEIADVCALVLELEPDLGLLCVDFMSSDIAGHLMWHRLDPSHPAHRPNEAGEELVHVYEAVDAACGRIIEQAQWLWNEEPTVLVLSDHGMKPTHWLFRANRWLEDAGYLRFRTDASSATPSEAGAYAPELEETIIDAQPPYADIDFSATRAYCFGYGGQIYLGEVTGAEGDRRLADALAEALAEVPHPESGEPAFDVLRKDELYHGFYFDKAPELVFLPATSASMSTPLASAGARRSSATSTCSLEALPTSRASMRSPASWLPPGRGSRSRTSRRARTSPRFQRHSSPCTASRRRSTPRHSKRFSPPTSSARGGKWRRSPGIRRAPRLHAEGGGADRAASSRPRLRVAQGRRAAALSASHVSSTGPRSTSRTRPGSRSRPVGSTSGRNSRQGSTPRPRSSTRYHTASSPADRRTGTFPGRRWPLGRS